MFPDLLGAPLARRRSDWGHQRFAVRECMPVRAGINLNQLEHTYMTLLPADGPGDGIGDMVVTMTTAQQPTGYNIVVCP